MNRPLLPADMANAEVDRQRKVMLSALRLIDKGRPDYAREILVNEFNTQYPVAP